MKSIQVKSPGGAEQLFIAEADIPHAGPDEVLVRIKATAVNRADILQREGKYPPPQGASHLLGLEMSGTIEAIGSNVTEWKQGDEVFGLLPGGGYAEYAVIQKNMALQKPDYLSFEEAAAIPEVFLTAYQALVWLGNLQFNENILIHAGASGVGTAAIQIANQIGANIMVTASANKHKKCLDLGAHYAIDYKSEKFAEKVDEVTHKKGVDMILDFVGGPYLQDNINSLAMDGRLVLLAALGGVKVENLNMAKILTKRLQVTGSTLRSRSIDYQIRLTNDFWSFSKDLFAKGLLKPVIDKVYDWKDVAQAHNYMESNQNIGKIVLKIRD